MVIFQYNLYIFCLDITRLFNYTVYAMDPNNSVIKRLWCTFGQVPPVMIQISLPFVQSDQNL